MKYINLHTHNKQESECETSILNLFPADADNFIKKHNRRFCSIGLHPWHIDKSTAFSLIENIEIQAKNHNILAIGEIGLDRKCDVEFKLQEEILKKQLEIAEKLNKPVIWHVVKSYSEVLSLKKNLGPAVPWILHNFHAKAQITLSLANQGFYFSFGAMLMNEKSKNADILQLIPINNLFFENDTSEIPIENVYKKASDILSLPNEKLKQITNENFLRIFGKRNE